MTRHEGGGREVSVPALKILDIHGVKEHWRWGGMAGCTPTPFTAPRVTGSFRAPCLWASEYLCLPPPSERSPSEIQLRRRSSVHTRRAGSWTRHPGRHAHIWASRRPCEGAIAILIGR